MWKVADFQDLPEWLEDKKQTAVVKESTVSFQSQGQDFKIYYQTASPVSDEKGLTVLLLHGMRFSSQTWTDLGTLHVLAVLGYSAVAIDLPGYAKSKDQKPLDDTACFLTDVIAALKLDRPVLVSPSLSGSYTLPFLLGAQPEKAGEKSRGYMPVAPIYTDQFEEEVYKKCQVPTLIVQGSKDIPMGSTASQHLAALPNSYLHIMEGGGHPCYLDNPKEWHYLLYNFLDVLTK